MTGSSSAPPWEEVLLSAVHASGDFGGFSALDEAFIYRSSHSRKHYWVESCPQSERQASGWGGTTALAGQWGSILKNASHIAGL